MEARGPGHPTQTRKARQAAGGRTWQTHQSRAGVRSARVVETKQDEVTDAHPVWEDAVREAHPTRAAEARQAQVEVAQGGPAARQAFGEVVLGAQATAERMQATPTTR